MDLKDSVRSIKAFPKEGIIFRDVTTLFKDPAAFHLLMDQLARSMEEKGVDVVVGPEARGFIMGAPLAFFMDVLANILHAGFVPVRKPGKLPAQVLSYSYDLEYGSDTIEIHKDAIKPGMKVALVDDLLATGGTALAACKLIEQLGGQVVAVRFAIELADMDGRERLDGYDVQAAMSFEGD